MLIPTASHVKKYLGPGSNLFVHTMTILTNAFCEAKNDSPVKSRFAEWERYIPELSDKDAIDLFCLHTYLSIMSRLICARAIDPAISKLSLPVVTRLMNGEYFMEEEIYNLGTNDFFSWVLDAIPETTIRDMHQNILESLLIYDLNKVDKDVLSSLYEKSSSRRVDSKDPNRHISYEPGLITEVDCAGGGFLADIVRAHSIRMLEQNYDHIDIVLHLSRNLIATESDPGWISIARANFIISLAKFLKLPHPWIAVPIYLTNPSYPIERSRIVGDAATYLIKTAHITFEVPQILVSDMDQLNILVRRLPQYLSAVQLRTMSQNPNEAIKDVTESLFAYLKSPKKTEFIELPGLSSNDATIICGIFRKLSNLMLEGKGTFWLDIINNHVSTIHLNQ